MQDTSGYSHEAKAKTVTSIIMKIFAPTVKQHLGKYIIGNCKFGLKAQIKTASVYYFMILTFPALTLDVIIYRRQILTFKVDPRTKRVKYLSCPQTHNNSYSSEAERAN